MNPRMKKLSFALMQVLGVGVAATVVSAPAGAQQTAQTKERIEVTGSNIKRIEGESALPVTVISREEISKTGATTAAELLNTISAIGSGGYSLAQGIGEAGRPGNTSVSLRGLGDTNTLILLNGRRLANYAFSITGGATNLNQIPISAIERVEVLKDGASAIYGTDAIGGVINFILRKDFQGIELSAYGTHTENGGGNQRRYSGLFGFGDLSKQRFNVLLNLDYQKDDPLAAAQRPFAATGIRPDMGFILISSRAYPANFTYHGTNYNVSAAQGCVPAMGSHQVDGSGNPAPTRLNCVQDFTNVIDIFPPSERKGLFTRGAFQISNDNQLFVEYHLQKNKITYAISEVPTVPNNGPLLFPVSSPFYPSSFVAANGQTITPTGPLVFTWRTKPEGRRTDRVDTEEQRLVAGAQGVVAGWDYNTAFAHSESKAGDNYIDGYVSENRLRAILATGNINVFSTTPLPQDQIDLLQPAKILEKVREAKTKVDAVDFKASRELYQMNAGPLALAVGAEHRKENLKDTNAPVLTSGDVLGGGGNFQDQSASRNVTGVFGELNVPILKNLEAQLAVRYDKYSDFGNTTNPKLALRFTPTKELLLRGSYSTGFRAPTLSDLFYPQFQGNTSGSHSDPVRCPGGTPLAGGFVASTEECEIQFNSLNGGNPALKPERSRQWTLGAVFEPSNTMSLGVDYWAIHRRDSINTIGDGTIFDQYALTDPITAQGFFIRNARDATGGCVGDLPGSPATPANVPCAIKQVVQLQANLGKYNVTGIDVTGTARFPTTGAGRVSLRFDGTYVITYRYQQAKDADYLDNLGITTTDNGAITRWRHYATLNWSLGPWGASLSQNFVLGYKDDTSLGNPPRRVNSYETYDVQGSWGGWRGLSLNLGVHNLFDRDPPASANSQNFQVGYDPRYTDPRGRTYYAQLKYLFK
jgi:iron complex outermembrane receptor protein